MPRWASELILALFLLCSQKQHAADPGNEADERKPVEGGFEGHTTSFSETVETRFPPLSSR